MSSTPTNTTSGATASSEFFSLLNGKAEKIRMLPSVATQALEIVKDPDCAIGEFASVVEHDMKLAADILRLANSAVYRVGAPVVSLHEAVIRLGFRQCKNLILSSCMSTMMKSVDLEEEWIRGVLWKHSYVTAVAALHLNRTLHLGFQGEEFTAGLMHDIGRTLFAVLVPERFSEIDPLEFDESAATLEHERTVIGGTHAELGAAFADRNKLPSALVDVVQYHHTPLEATNNRELVALIHAADHVANHLQRFNEPLGYDPLLNPGIQIIAAERGARIMELFASSANEIMNHSLQDAAEAVNI
ncbi:MAG: HDOD domain-containing protein [Pirellulaceae bacterium]|nr:HDOD domain-containing protein [Planctomycetales bacterium]